MGTNKLNNVVELYIKGFIFLFLIGGFTGVIIANAYIDTWLHDTYYIIAHFHYVLSIAALFAVIISYYLYSPYIIGNKYNRILSKIQFYSLLIGVNITFFPLH